MTTLAATMERGPEAITGVIPEAQAHDMEMAPAPIPEVVPVEAEQGRSSIIDRLRNSRLGTMLAIGGATLALAGAAEGVKAQDASAAYTSVGPALSHNINKANKQLDYVLEKTGPNGALAREIGDHLGIESAKGRRRYITPENIDLGRKLIATNDEYPRNTGASGNTPVSIPNEHESSTAFTVVADETSSQSKSVVKETEKGKFELKYSVLRQLCENMLSKGGGGHGGGHVLPKFKMDVSWGLKKDLKKISKDLSKSNSAAEVTCPDGTTVEAGASAYGRAFAKVIAHIREKGHIFISGRGNVNKFEKSYEEKLNLYAKTATSAGAKTYIKVGCGTNEVPPTPPITPPTPPTPPVTPPSVNTPPSVDLIGPQHVLTGDEIEVCAYGSDPNNDIVSTTFSETGNGNFISSVFSGDEPGEFCVDYKAGTESDNASITATVIDSANQSDSDTEYFPIVGDDDPRGQF